MRLAYGSFTMLEAYLNVLDLGYFEVREVFHGLADENVWRRPAEGLLSIGEMAGHVAYWEALKFAGDATEKPLPDLSKCRVGSPLIDHRFRYYSTNLADHPSERQLQLTASEACAELLRVHDESISYFKLLNPDLESSPPGWPPQYTYSHLLQYAAFHVSYHIGQMYTARHLLGERTPDN